MIEDHTISKLKNNNKWNKILICSNNIKLESKYRNPPKLYKYLPFTVNRKSAIENWQWVKNAIIKLEAKWC